MQNHIRSIRNSMVLVLCLAVMAGPALSASITKQVLTVAGAGFVVTKAAGPLNSFINTITLRHGMKSTLATKVVPVLSVGEKGYIGGAQVIGPKSAVDAVQAVFQYEKNFSNNNYRAKVLVPSSSVNPLKLQRVAKVGVSATIDVSLDGGQRYFTVGNSLGLKDALRGGAILVAVKNFGPTINKGLNTLTFNKGLNTKVVPMLTVGEKAYLGGAQISAASSSIGKVAALWQYEDLFMDGKFRVKVLVPTSSSNPLKMKRIDGAGVSAVIDFALTRQSDVDQPDERTGVRRTVGSVLDKVRSEVDGKDSGKDNGLHKGWEIGKHKGWDKNGKDKGR